MLFYQFRHVAGAEHNPQNTGISQTIQQTRQERGDR
jgi:hypothetical protein